MPIYNRQRTQQKTDYCHGRSLLKRRVWFTDESGDKPPPAENGNEGNTTQPDADKSGEKTFTQDELNAFLARNKRETKSTTEKALLEQFGVSKASDLKTLVDEAAALKQAQLSDVEKAQQTAELAKQNNEALQAEIDALKAQQKADEQRRYLTQQLTTAGAKNADDLYTLLRAKDSDKINGLFVEGNPDEAALKKFVTAVQQSHALYFVPSGAGSPSNAGGVVGIQRVEAMAAARKKIRTRITR